MNRLYLCYPKKTHTIRPELYGHFSEHIGGVFYDGLWVGRDSAIPNLNGFRRELVERFRAVHPPVLRWPGGCFAETYDWRDGIGSQRPVRPNWWLNSDGRYESNQVGTHEFIELCRLIGAKPYFAANLTSTTPQHIRDWMDYCLSPKGSTTLALEREQNGSPQPFEIPYWGVGNENWGGGGNMTPEMYTGEFRRYATLMHNIAPQAQLFVCGTNGDDYHWTQKVMEGLVSSERHVAGFAMHYYCRAAGNPLSFSEAEWDQMMVQAQRMEEIIVRNWNIICGFGMEQYCQLVVDEWGCWHPDGSGPSKGRNLFEQQSTMRDAMVAALTLNIFNRHCDKVRMANLAQTVNNLHSLFLAGGSQFTVTPTYYVFDLFQAHQGARLVETIMEPGGTSSPNFTVSASRKEGKTLVTIGNLSCVQDQEVILETVGQGLPDTGLGKMLWAQDLHDHNTFEQPHKIVPTDFSFDPAKPVHVPKGGIVALSF